MSHETLLAHLSSFKKSFHAFIGLDGFIDEVVHVVAKRHDSQTYDRVTTLAEYGDKIARASGLSINVEIETISQKLGGNGPIFAFALKKFGAKVTYIVIHGYVHRLPLTDCLPLGTAASSYYVRNAKSGDPWEVAAFVRQWRKGLGEN